MQPKTNIQPIKIRHRHHKKVKVSKPRKTVNIKAIHTGAYSKVRITYDRLVGPVHQDFLDSDSSFGRLNTFIGTYNPYWRDQVKNGSNAGTAANGILYEPKPIFIDSNLYGTARGAKGVTTDWIHSTYSGFVTPSNFGASNSAASASLVTRVTNRAIVKFLDVAESKRSFVEGGQDLGEIKETVRSVLHPFKSLRDLTFRHLDSLKKEAKKAKVLKSFAKVVADSYLEYRFGWRPLALDIHDQLEGLVNNFNHPDTEHVEAGASETFSISNAGLVFLTNSASHTFATANTNVIGKYSVRYKGGIRTGAVNGHISRLHGLQIDLPHAAPTVWDLLPYSWIVDYFTNVGDIIRAVSFVSSNVTWLMRTDRTVWTYNYAVQQSNPQMPVNFTVDGFEHYSSGNVAMKVHSWSRTPISAGSLLPDVQLQVPLGSFRPWENMGALLAGRLDSIRKILPSLKR
jgi:hypothetical protein